MFLCWTLLMCEPSSCLWFIQSFVQSPQTKTAPGTTVEYSIHFWWSNSSILPLVGIAGFHSSETERHNSENGRNTRSWRFFSIISTLAENFDAKRLHSIAICAHNTLECDYLPDDVSSRKMRAQVRIRFALWRLSTRQPNPALWKYDFCVLGIFFSCKIHITCVVNMFASHP